MISGGPGGGEEEGERENEEGSQTPYDPNGVGGFIGVKLFIGVRGLPARGIFSWARWDWGLASWKVSSSAPQTRKHEKRKLSISPPETPPEHPRGALHSVSSR